MFDPTIYENLKVVLEGELYDRDSSGYVLITDRQDIVNLATMSRSYSVSFSLQNKPQLFKATITLEATTSDLYGEILEKDQQLGCKLVLFIDGPIKDTMNTPAFIDEQLTKKWDNRPTIEQQVYYDWTNNEMKEHHLKVKLTFNRNINEDHISDFSQIINLLIESLEIVEKVEINP